MRWGRRLDFKCFDTRRGGPASERQLDTVDCRLISFDQRFHPPIGQISHVAVHAFARGGGLREHSEANALHTAADQESSRDDHDCTFGARSTVTSTVPSGSSMAMKRSSGVSAPRASGSAGR